jgi:hypothetical protein
MSKHSIVNSVLNASKEVLCGCGNAQIVKYPNNEKLKCHRKVNHNFIHELSSFLMRQDDIKPLIAINTGTGEYILNDRHSKMSNYAIKITYPADVYDMEIYIEPYQIRNKEHIESIINMAIFCMDTYKKSMLRYGNIPNLDILIDTIILQ